MVITVQLPDDVSSHENPGREILDAFVIACYQTEKLSSQVCREMLGMGRLEFQTFLKIQGVPDHTYGVQELLQDIETGDRLRAESLLAG